MVRLSKPYPFKFFKGCLPQILLGPFLNTLSHIFYNIYFLSTEERIIENLGGTLRLKEIFQKKHHIERVKDLILPNIH